MVKLYNIIRINTNRKKHLAFNVSYYLAASVIGAIIQLLINPFLALKMEHYDYAIIGFYSSFGSILTPLISFYLASFYARNFFLVDPEQRESLRNSVSVLSIGVSLAMTIVGLTGMYIYYSIASVSFPFFPYALLSISSILFNSLYTIYIVDLKMKMQAKKFLFVHLSHALTSGCFAVVMVILLGLGGLGKMLATAVTALVFFIFSFKSLITKLQCDWIYLRSILKFCWPLVVSGMLAYFTSGIDRAMLERVNDVNNLGLYSIGIQLMGYTALFTTSLSNTFQPDIYRFIAERNIAKMLIVVLFVMVLGALPMGIFIIFATPILSLLTFGRFTAAASFARILALKNVSSEMHYTLAMIIEGYGYTKLLLWCQIIGSIVMIFVFTILINMYGFYGAAWGQVLSPLIMFFVTVLYLLVVFRGQVIQKVKAIVSVFRMRF